MRKYSPFFLSVVYCLPARPLLILLMAGGLSTCIFAQTWHKLGTGIGYSSICVTCLKLINNDLYIGGGFGTQFGGKANSVAKYNSTTEIWDSVGVGVAGEVKSMETYNGELYVGGDIQGAGYWPYNLIPNTYSIAKWNGSQWLSVDSAFSSNMKAQSGGIYPIKFNNDLYIGGFFYNLPVSNGNAKEIVRYNGSTFDNMLGGVDGFPLDVMRMTVYKNELIVGGTFLQAGGVMGYNNIARWNGTNWDSLGSGVNNSIRSLTVDTVNDILYAGGDFTMAGGLPVHFVARWDGTQWNAVPPLPTQVLPAALKIFNGKLYAGIGWNTGGPADTVLMRLDSNGWVPIFGPIGGSVEALEVYNGNLYVGGCFDKVDTTVVNLIACYGDSCPGTPITLTLPYGVNDPETSSGLRFKVYPNPAKKEITLEITPPPAPKGEGSYVVRIKNSIGQEITQRVIPSGARNLIIDTSQFPKGLLLVEVCTPSPSGRDGAGLCHTEKVVVE